MMPRDLDHRSVLQDPLLLSLQRIWRWHLRSASGVLGSHHAGSSLDLQSFPQFVLQVYSFSVDLIKANNRRINKQRKTHNDYLLSLLDTDKFNDYWLSSVDSKCNNFAMFKRYRVNLIILIKLLSSGDSKICWLFAMLRRQWVNIILICYLQYTINLISCYF